MKNVNSRIVMYLMCFVFVLMMISFVACDDPDDKRGEDGYAVNTEVVNSLVV